MRVHEIQICNDLQPQYLQEVAYQAAKFSSDIKIKFDHDDLQLDVKSILGMMMIPLRSGTKITLQTRGRDEKEAIDTMCDLLENKS
ncbi:HPr family phosphocarrier protein [Paenibacillus sp. LMG 31456]|uniref:HPr family phosphocarrier protein n=1 Tax=Paenibacillus foliorum TaxID=2654974 RepID=A0A972GP03_9BACL|nr:HPr family phosphocarrier protein [Paenibacillus foliorum]NOU94204.1 HPr family phosphocarrier protein [Paenibacillus foliorum]